MLGSPGYGQHDSCTFILPGINKQLHPYFFIGANTSVGAWPVIDHLAFIIFKQSTPTCEAEAVNMSPKKVQHTK